MKRNDNETIKDYKIRLFDNKEKYGLTSQQIADLINKETGENYNESTYRKWHKAFCDGREYAILKNIDSNELLNEFENKKVELQKEKYKLYDQRNSLNKTIRDTARWEEIKNLLINTIETKDLPKFDYKYNRIEKSDNDLLIFLNDIHFGLEIHNYFNDYSPQIFLDRLKQYLNKIIQVKELHKSENCYVFIGGDLISGNIHPQIQVANTEDTIQQIQSVSEYICEFINELYPYFENIYINLVPGNHSRLEKNKKEAIKDERLDLLVPWYMKARLQNIKNVSFVDNKIDNTISVLDIRGKLYYGVHGDYDSPKNAVSNLSLMLGEKPYAILMAHLHHNSVDTIQDVKVIMSASFSGMDDYCIEKRLIGKPAQLICVCNKDKIDCFYDVEFE